LVLGDGREAIENGGEVEEHAWHDADGASDVANGGEANVQHASNPAALELQLVDQLVVQSAARLDALVDHGQLEDCDQEPASD
jgi:hypothetical protein